MDCAYFRTHQIKTQRFFSVVCECNSRPVAERSRSHTIIRGKLWQFAENFLPQKSQKIFILNKKLTI